MGRGFFFSFWSKGKNSYSKVYNVTESKAQYTAVRLTSA